MTDDEFFNLATIHKDALLFIVRAYHPASKEPRPTLPITAYLAELACTEVRNQIAHSCGDIDPATEFESRLIKRQRFPLIQLLQETWFGIPESRELVQSLDGFNTLCDLIK